MKLRDSIAILVTCFGPGLAVDPVLDPVPVCDVVTKWKDFDQQTVAVFGRYSFRQTGRWLDEESCGGKAERGVLWLAADPKGAPRPPDAIQINEGSLYRKFDVMKQKTVLGSFRFGSTDYDRWAVVYGRVEMRKDSKNYLVYRGDGAIFFFAGK